MRGHRSAGGRGPGHTHPLCGEEQLSDPPLPAEEQNIQINQSEVNKNIPREGTKEGADVQQGNAHRRARQRRGRVEQLGNKKWEMPDQNCFLIQLVNLVISILKLHF